jgi:hypothetical protein
VPKVIFIRQCPVADKMPKLPKVKESAFSANQFLFKLTVPKAHTLTLAHFKL